MQVKPRYPLAPAPARLPAPAPAYPGAPALHRASLLILGWSLVAPILLFAIFHAYGFDDPYITYRYAVNLAAGQGFVYNPGERVLSTTAPLYALLLAPFAAPGLDVPLISNLIGCVSLGAGALALWRLGSLAGMPVAGGVAALLYPLSPYLVLTLGAETAFFMALTLWGFVALAAGYPAAAGLLLAGATLTRADAALAAVIGGSALLLEAARAKLRRDGPASPARLSAHGIDTPGAARESSGEHPRKPSPLPNDGTAAPQASPAGRWVGRIPPLLRFSGAYLLIVAPFLGVAWIYFGTPLPATLGVKRSQAHIPGSRSYLAGLGQQLAGLAQRPLFWPLLGLVPPGLMIGLWRRGPLLLPLVWGGLHALAYGLLGVTAYFWYYGPAALALITTAALGAEALVAWLRPWRRAWASAIVVSTLVGMILAAQGLALARMASHPDPRLPLYRAAGQWLASSTTSDDRVGALEVGVIGYYSGRPMVDFAGLIQPEVARTFEAGGGYEAAARRAVAAYRPAYLVNQEAAMPLVSNDPDLAARCVGVAEFPDPRYPTPLTIYRCAW
ncbi:MAG: hypothetical protein SNJ69_02845 [Chloroflexaceae bacterium]